MSVLASLVEPNLPEMTVLASLIKPTARRIMPPSIHTMIPLQSHEGWIEELGCVLDDACEPSEGVDKNHGSGHAIPMIGGKTFTSQMLQKHRDLHKVVLDEIVRYFSSSPTSVEDIDYHMEDAYAESSSVKEIHSQTKEAPRAEAPPAKPMASLSKLVENLNVGNVFDASDKDHLATVKPTAFRSISISTPKKLDEDGIEKLGCLLDDASERLKYVGRECDLVQENHGSDSSLALMSEIVENLYLGDVFDSSDEEGLVAHGITHIVDLANTGDLFDGSDEESWDLFDGSDEECLTAHGITHIVDLANTALVDNANGSICRMKKHVDDDEHADLTAVFDDINLFVIGALENGGTVLVHCFEGKSRSAAVVVQFLMQYRNMSLAEALKITKQGRPTIKIDPGFKAQLMALEHQLYPDQPPSINLGTKRRKKRTLQCMRENGIDKIGYVVNHAYERLEDEVRECDLMQI